MRRRFLCLLLVPLMLANQGLCFSHTHRGTDVSEPEGHASRPHFHFGSHGQHDSTHDHDADHSHGDNSGRDQRSDDHGTAVPPSIAPLGDHDADAVYCVEAATIARDENSVIVLSAKYVAVAAVLYIAQQSDVSLLRVGLIRGRPPSVFAAACPIYLRTLSLRI